MVQDATGGIRAETAALPNVSPGDAVEVVGFPVQYEFGWALSEVLWRPTEPRAAPEPVPLSSDNIIQPQHNGVLASVEVVLLDQNSSGDPPTLNVQLGQRA